MVHTARMAVAVACAGGCARQLKRHTPPPLDSLTLLEMAIPAFGLAFVSTAARNLYYDNTFRRQLFSLMEQDSIERLALTRRDAARTCWRWKEPTDLSEIQAQADLAGVN